MPTGQRALIVTALDLETHAVLEQLGDVRPEYDGPLPVQRGTLRCAPNWEVVVVQAGANNLNASTYATAALLQFRPAVMMFVGVCGGFEAAGLHELDLVVPPDVHYYGLGAAKDEFEHRPFERSVSRYAFEVAKTVAGEAAWPEAATETVPDTCLVRLEPLASGDHVIKSLSSATYTLIRNISSKIVGVDMEASGFLTATRWSQATHTLVVRGVSDLVADKDPDKDLRRQPRAAKIAAVFASAVLRAMDGSRELVVLHDADAESNRSLLARDLVAELDRLLCVDQWHGLTEGLFWADPPKWWRRFDDCLVGAVAFLRGRTAIPGAPEIDDAFANLLRILEDLRAVLQKDAEPMNDPDAFWMRKYYRDAYGDHQLNQHALGEQWIEECRLAKNLAIEATRGINLVHERIRASHDPMYRVAAGLVGVFVGDDDTFQPIVYSSEETQEPRPYPGLAEFPRALNGRDAVFHPPAELGDGDDATA